MLSVRLSTFATKSTCTEVLPFHCIGNKMRWGVLLLVIVVLAASICAQEPRRTANAPGVRSKAEVARWIRWLLSRSRVVPKENKMKAKADDTVDDFDDLDFDASDGQQQSKRQVDDYGHMRYGKREFDDYGHMRFGR